MEQLSKNQISEKYRGEWVLFGEPEKRGRHYFAKVLCHSSNRKYFFEEARKFMDENLTLFCYVSPEKEFYRETHFLKGVRNGNNAPEKVEIYYQKRAAKVISDVAYKIFAYRDYPTASELYGDAVELLDGIGDKNQLRGVLLNWGVVSMTGTRPDINNAEIQLTRGLNLATKLIWRCIFGYELAYVYCFKGQPEKAVGSLLSAIEIAYFLCNEAELKLNLDFLARVLTEFVQSDEELQSLLTEQLDIFYKTTSLSAELPKESKKIVDLESLLRERGLFSLWHLKNESHRAKTDTHKWDATPDLNLSSTAYPSDTTNA
jgi:hypothetical protein